MSSKQTFEDALKDIQKMAHFVYAYGGDDNHESPESDRLEIAIKKGRATIQKEDGYWMVKVSGSDEGVFGLLDIESTNPDVQNEIKTLGLMKYAQEWYDDHDNSWEAIQRQRNNRMYQ